MQENIPIKVKKKGGRPRNAVMPVPGKSATHTGKPAPFPLKRFKQFLSVLKIQSRDYGLTPFKMLGTQIYVLEEICRGLEQGITTFVILKARQIGISTLLLALDIFWAMEHPGLLGAFGTHEEGARDQFRNQIDIFFETVPDKFKLQCVTNNKTMMVLENNSLFRYLVAGTRGSTNKLGRAGGYNYLHATEVAFYGSEDDIKALNQTLSELYPHRLYIYESTANGFNHYQEMWETACASPAQRAIFVAWWRNELYRFGHSHPLFEKYMPKGKNTPLLEHERRMVKEVREQFQVQLDAEQMAWWRHHLETKCNGDLLQMRQEMPATPDDAFVSTGSQFFTNEAITAQVRDARRHKCMPFMVKLTKSPYETSVTGCKLDRADLKIWEAPSPFGQYIISCDSAYGANEESDNSVISVERCFADVSIQVAEYASGSVQPYQLAWVLAFLGGFYGNVMVILELNNSGHAVFNELQRFKENIKNMPVPESAHEFINCVKSMREYMYRREDSLSGNLLRQWVTSPNNKTHLMERYKTGFETGRTRVRSLVALDEHRKIERNGAEISGAAGSKDDRVIAKALGYYAYDQWARIPLVAKGKTYAKEMELENNGGDSPLNIIYRGFLEAKGISVKDRPPV